MKTEGPVNQKMAALATPLVITLFTALIILSIWTPLSHPQIAHRWFSMPNIFFLLPVPLLVAACSYGILHLTRKNASHQMPFFLALCLLFLGFSGLGISIWPAIIPPSVSIWQASAPPQSQAFMLIGVLLIIPVILMYTTWSYYVFRGKVRSDDNYH